MLPLLPNTRGRFSGEPSGAWGRLTLMNHSSASQEPEEVALLTGPRAASVLSAALAPAGQRLASWEVHSVHHRPGAGVSVGYTAVVVAPNGRSTTEYLCATTARLSNPHAPGLTRVAPTGGDGPAVHVWRHPAGTGGRLHALAAFGPDRHPGQGHDGRLPAHASSRRARHLPG